MAAALPVLANEGGLSRYLDEIRRFPMLEPTEEYMLAKMSGSKRLTACIRPTLPSDTTSPIGRP
jgi:DNA-directed RNA polymerase sigma subunit (sigma70/sigma32)